VKYVYYFKRSNDDSYKPPPKRQSLSPCSGITNLFYKLVKLCVGDTPMSNMLRARVEKAKISDDNVFDVGHTKTCRNPPQCKECGKFQKMLEELIAKNKLDFMLENESTLLNLITQNEDNFDKSYVDKDNQRVVFVKHYMNLHVKSPGDF
jgi:hypothetical protein